MLQQKRDGIIKRDKQTGNTVITVVNEPWSLDFSGVTCLNPEDPEHKRKYQKVFAKKPIYFRHEYDRLLAERFSQKDNFVVSMSGYSKITEEQRQRYGVQEKEYEVACCASLRNILRHLRSKFTGAHLQLTYGASDVGVDWSIEEVAREFNIVPVGFSCPRFMLYVKDDGIPVFVANNSEEYGDYFIRTLDLLIVTGGRAHALQHDVLASCIYNKRLHFVDVLNILSRTGGVAATVQKPDGRIEVENAAAAMGRNISFFGLEEAITTLRTVGVGDKWDAVFANINTVATDVCRRKMSPERKFV